MPRPFQFSCTAALAVAAALLVTHAAEAQSQSLFGNRGPISQRNAQGGSGSAAGAGMFSRGAQSGAAGRTQGAAGQTPQIGNVTGFSGGFVGASDNIGRFVGGQQTGQQGAIGQTNRIGQAARGRAGNANNRLNQNGLNQGQFGNQAGNRARYNVRPVQRIAFEYPQPQRTEVRTSLQSQFQRLSDRREELAGVTIQLAEGQQAILRGEVDSENARKLAEAVTRLEPGVRSVKNEIRVRNP